MLISAYLLGVAERQFTRSDGDVRIQYTATIVDNDDHEGSVIRLQLPSLDVFKKLQPFLRQTVKISAYIRSWTFEGRRGQSLVFLDIAE